MDIKTGIFEEMDRKMVILAAVISVVGVLTIFSTWYKMYVYPNFELTYAGISILLSGDFTSKDGIFYGSAGTAGVFVPTLVALAFMAIFLRFMVKTNGPYLKDVSIPGILIVVGALYSMYWVNPGLHITSGGTEIHGSGIGLALAIVIVLILGGIAYYLDHGFASPAPTDRYRTFANTARMNSGAAPAVPVDQGRAAVNETPCVGTPSYVAFCTNCGKGFSPEDVRGQNFCKYCGHQLRGDFRS